MHLLLRHMPRGRSPRRGKHEQLLCGRSPTSRYNNAFGSMIEALSLIQPTNGKLRFMVPDETRLELSHSE